MFRSWKDQASAKQYVAIAEKVLVKGADYITGEVKRLTGMIANPGVKPDSKTKFFRRRGISFICNDEVVISVK